MLKTVTTNVEYEYPEETVVTKEDIHTLDLLGIEKAQSLLKEKNDTRYKFYCVGYSVVKYYLNEEVYSNIEGHKAEVISEDIIVTFCRRMLWTDCILQWRRQVLKLPI